MKYDYSETVEYILDWYDLNKRILPWRDQKNPYYTWVSEIMLQQTRVEAVKFYFERFTKELPTIQSLASADEEKLLKLWEGLGYYSRVRNLQKAAIMVEEEYDGSLPKSYEELLKLPGIGSYTAGAIASIAFDIAVPAVDGNVLRVMKRVAASFDDITKASVKKELEEDLKEIMPQERPGDFNQGIMEIGATVCIPNGKPLCQKCPLMHLCIGFHRGQEMMLPVKPKKKDRKIEERTVIILKLGNRYSIKKRPSTGLLKGLWELPNSLGYYSSDKLSEILIKLGLKEFDIHPLGEAKHIFSHIEWQMKGFLIDLSSHKEKEDFALNLTSHPYSSKDIILKLNELSLLNEDSSNNNLEMDEEEILMSKTLNNCIWVSKEEMEELYTLPTAFTHYKNYCL